ncbi:hypothetical protein [Wolbachia endosymbiont of Drosophila tsacasi]|uniref:hypothetical protein n=1 Tax=Wolbachia endosymbiont of Drosophila tsacasi TaxID=3002579 RepID=UPI0023A9C180|nr:hypothetical protein [Wolbachia endosymbiont of Drosophila tsacasi]MDE5062370.1 hypothetical protein [Wolbachia endosymbiont of Drosophila tsacasi]
MTYTKIEKRNISFYDAKLKFSNNGLQTDSSSNESIDSIGKKFKYEVKLPGVIHTTARKNNVGDGFNELNARKEANFVAPELSVAKKKKVTFANPEDHIIPTPTRSEYMMQKEREAKKSNPFKTLMKTMPVYKNVDDTFPELPACAYKPALFPKPSKEKVREALDRMRNNSKASSSASVENDTLKISSLNDVFASHPTYKGKKRFSPLLRNNAEVYGNITSGTKPYSITEKCMVTHDGNALEAEMERKHGFQSDPSIKHVKADTATCSITKGNDKRDIRPDASYEQQEPLSDISKVNVKELANKFRG